MITSFYRVSEGPLQRDLSNEEIERIRINGQGILWVDLESPSPEAARAVLEGTFRFPHLPVDDCLNGRVDPPKIDDHGDYVFVVVQAIHFTPQDGALETTEFNLFLGKNYVVSYHDLPLPSVTAVRDRCEKDERLMGRGADYLAHALLDALVDDFLPIVEEMDDVIGELEERVLADPDHGRLQEIRLLRHNVLRLRRMLSPQR